MFQPLAMTATWARRRALGAPRTDAWLRRFHPDPPGRLHVDPPEDWTTPSIGPAVAFLAGPSWPTLTSRQGRTSSLRCGRSTLTCGSSSVIWQQSRNASTPGNQASLPVGWGRFGPSEWVRLEASQPDAGPSAWSTARRSPTNGGMPERRTHDYLRHGITSLSAAFNIADGAVLPAGHGSRAWAWRSGWRLCHK
jgi:hypothetical protein